jgi:hypothetical protein
MRVWARVSCAALLALATSARAATIIVVNQDGPGEGFNDPTPESPVGGNPGTTLGAQRLAAFQFAADIWSALLVSDVPIRIDATMDPLTCDSTSATLGEAGPTTIHSDFPGALVAGTWYPQALANKLAGVDLDAADDDITAQFSSAIGTTCSFPQTWYYGFDRNGSSSTFDFVSVVTHELGHGLGFETFVDETTGSKFMGLDDVFELNLEDHGTVWSSMSNAQRKASAIDTGGLFWMGPAVVAHSGILSSGRDGSGRVAMYAPNPVEPGSSVSHFDISLTPDELMEPFYVGPDHDPSLARDVMTDIGWGSDVPGSTTTTVSTTTLPSTTTTTLALTCPASPDADCRLAVHRQSSFRIVDRAMKQRLRWTWRGAASTIDDFRNPVSVNSTVRLCVYDSSAGAQPLVDVALPAVTGCPTGSCWRSLGKASHPTGFAFRNRAGTPDGIVAARLVAGGDGQARIVVKGRGSHLPTPPLGLGLPVTVELVIADASGSACWQTTFGTASRDDTGELDAKGP